MKYCNQCGKNTERIIPKNDKKLRYVCTSCKFIFYENPKVVVGTVPIYKNEVLLCLRGIEPRKNYWTLPAGYLENNESIAEGAIRESQEEAMFTPVLGPIIAIVDVVHVHQVHIFFRAGLKDLKFCLLISLFYFRKNPISQKAFYSNNLLNLLTLYFSKLF